MKSGATNPREARRPLSPAIAVGLWAALCVLLAAPAAAQKGGGRGLSFVDVPQVSRLVGSGGLHTVGGEPSPMMTFHNPAQTVDTTAESNLWIAVSPIGKGIVRASAAYSWRHRQLATFTAGLLWSGYGKFERYDANGINTGSFHANEFGVYLTMARRLAPWLTMGVTVKPLFGRYDDVATVGLALDYGALFSWRQGRLAAAFTLRNCGGTLKRPTEQSHRDPMPFSMAAAITYRPAKAPFRFFLTLRDLTQWKLATNQEHKLNFGDNLLRHILIGAELCPVKVFHANFGYDHRQRREATSSEAGGMAGFTWGVGVRLRRFAVDYSHLRYHVGGSLSSINVGIDLRKGNFGAPRRSRTVAEAVQEGPSGVL